MKLKLLFLSLMVAFLNMGCYATITGTVADAETGEPIEGAVVLAEWTVTKGFGLTHTGSYKVVEVVTDKDGRATISGVFNPFVNKPSITVYKKGYVAWNNLKVFPTNEERKDSQLQNGYLVKLERFKPEYTHEKHVTFIRSTYSFGLGADSKFEQAWRWEALLAMEELREKDK